MSKYNKDKLKELLKEAKGNQTLDQMAAKSGLSKYQLSRIISGNYQYTPRMATLRAIAEASGVPGFFEKMIETIYDSAPRENYEIEVLDDGIELLAEGPYNYVKMDEDDVEEEVLDDGSGNVGDITESETEAEVYEQADISIPRRNMCRAAITMSMASFGNGIKWSIMPEADNAKFIQYPLRFAIDQRPIQKWSFIFLYEYGGEEFEQVMQVLGRLAMSHPLYNEKISLVFTNRENYIKYTSREMTFSSYPLWNMNLSAMLVDFSEMQVTEECYLFLSDDMTEDSIASLQFPDSLMDDFILENVLDYRKKRK